MRITVNGLRAELSMHRSVNPDKWNRDKGRVNGNSVWADELNNYLKGNELKVYQVKKDLEERDLLVTANAVKNVLQGNSKDKTGILEIFADHNNKCRELIGKDFAFATVIRYETTMSHLGEFIQSKYQQQDVSLRSVNHEFIKGFEHYLKTKRECSHNTTVKYIRNFQKIIGIALKNDWIRTDPFSNISYRLAKVDRPVLNQLELKILIDKKIDNERITRVKDIFVFCCFTGLAFTDVKKLTQDHLKENIDGSKKTPRIYSRMSARGMDAGKLLKEFDLGNYLTLTTDFEA